MVYYNPARATRHGSIYCETSRAELSSGVRPTAAEISATNKAEASTVDSPAMRLLRLTPITSNSGNTYAALNALKYYGITGWTESFRTK
jgi:uncharacterized membrane protein